MQRKQGAFLLVWLGVLLLYQTMTTMYSYTSELKVPPLDLVVQTASPTLSAIQWTDSKFLQALAPEELASQLIVPNFARPVVDEAVEEFWGPPTEANSRIASGVGGDWVLRDFQDEFFPAELPENGCTICCAGNPGKLMPTCSKHLDIARLQVPNQSLHNFAEVIRLLQRARRAKNQPGNVKVYFVGDSLMLSMALAAICELRRAGRGVDSVAGTLRAQQGQIQVQINGQNATVLFRREPRPIRKAPRLAGLCRGTDLMIVGWGLWFSASNQDEFHNYLRLYYAHHLAVCRNTRLVYSSSRSSHFRYKNEMPVSGEYKLQHGGSRTRESDNHMLQQRCGKVLKYSQDDQRFDFRGRTILTTARASGIRPYVVTWDGHRTSPSNETDFSKVMHVIPGHILSLPFYRNYESYSDDRDFFSKDCLHDCWIPSIMNPYWDAMYTAVNDEFRLEDEDSIIVHPGTCVGCHSDIDLTKANLDVDITK